MKQPDSGRGFDRNYKRGAIMGLTVAEAFILLSFCLLLLFTWWQVDTERKSLIAAEAIAELTPKEKAAIIAGLSDGTFAAAQLLRDAGINLQTPNAVQDLKDYSRFMRQEDMKRMMDAMAKLSPDTRLSLSNAVAVTDEAMLLSVLSQLASGDTTVDVIASRLEKAAKSQGDMVSLLNQRLGGSIRAAGGSIDTRGAITLPQEVLFDANKDTVKNPKFLTEFCSAWLDALHSSGLDLSDLKIEGHASSEGPKASNSEEAYLFNLDLSQRRAKNALDLCLRGLNEPTTQSWAQQHLAAIGYSSARLILNPDGTEDRDASRRVMFSVALNQEGLIEDIKREVATEDVKMQAAGPARVIDGDTIEVEGTPFRLSGIDAPEMGQPCKTKKGEVFDCGEVARRGLEEAIAGSNVECEASTVDRYRRPVAICKVGALDLGETMIVNGFAVPFEAYSDAYVPQGTLAKEKTVGIWATSFVLPSEYRANE